MCAPAAIAGLIGGLALSGVGGSKSKAPKASSAMPNIPQPPVPAAPVQADPGEQATRTDQAMDAAKLKERQRAAMAKGTQSTLLTSPFIDQDEGATVRKKSLLGA